MNACARAPDETTPIPRVRDLPRGRGAIAHGSVRWLSLHYLVAQVTATLRVLRRQRNAGSGAALTFDGNRNDGLAGLDPGGEPQPVEQFPLECREVSLAEAVVVRVLTEPIEGRNPASRQRRPNASEAYCLELRPSVGYMRVRHDGFGEDSLLPLKRRPVID